MDVVDVDDIGWDPYPKLDRTSVRGIGERGDEPLALKIIEPLIHSLRFRAQKSGEFADRTELYESMWENGHVGVLSVEDVRQESECAVSCSSGCVHILWLYALDM